MPSLSIPDLARPARGVFDKFTNYKTPEKFRIFAPQLLRDRVQVRRDKANKSVPCMQHMSLMMECWKNNDFNDYKCEAQVKAFTDCWANYYKTKQMREMAASKGQIMSVGGRLPSELVNQMLKNYPQPKSL